MNREIWIKVLDKWQEEGMGNNGCTLPYLVGVQTETQPRTEPSVSDAEDILEYLFSAENQDQYFIRKCFENGYTKTIIQKDFYDDNNSLQSGNVWVDCNICGYVAVNKEEVIKRLVDEAKPRIDAKTYSINENGEWGGYSVDDKTFFKNIFSK